MLRCFRRFVFSIEYWLMAASYLMWARGSGSQSDLHGRVADDCSITVPACVTTTRAYQALTADYIRCAPNAIGLNGGCIAVDTSLVPIVPLLERLFTLSFLDLSGKDNSSFFSRPSTVLGLSGYETSRKPTLTQSARNKPKTAPSLDFVSCLSRIRQNVVKEVSQVSLALRSAEEQCGSPGPHSTLPPPHR